MDKMHQWRDGLLSDSEIIAWLLNDIAEAYRGLSEVREAMYERETKAADERCARLGV